MKVPDIVELKINRLPKGYVFTYHDFIHEVKSKEALIKTLNRMVKSGKISKLSKGKYYKQEITPFGNLNPSQSQIVKDLLEEDGKIIGYLTGTSIYNSLGLTTQVSNSIQIGRKDVRPRFQRDYFIISFIRQKNTITKQNISLLQILDAIRFIKKIPDTTVESSFRMLLNIIKELPQSDRADIVRLSAKYPPATKAVLGIILDEMNEHTMADDLRRSLNPITSYELTGIEKVSKYAKLWNIK